MLSQKSDDGSHIVVKIQHNNTPNGSPQLTQVLLQDWAVFVIQSGYNLCISHLFNTIPKECDFRGQLQYNKLHPYGPTAASTTVMLCGLTQQTCSNVTYICTTSDTI